MWPKIEELNKPIGRDCQHLRRERANGCCSIRKQRPKECRTFNCVWLLSPSMPEEFRPDRCGIMLVGRKTEPVTIEVWEVDVPYEGSDLQRWVEENPMSKQYEWVLYRPEVEA